MALVALSVVEQRLDAVRAVLAGATVTEVAAQVGVSRQSVHAWIGRYLSEGVAGLADRPRRPRSCPHQAVPSVEVLVAEMRRQHPRWGAKRIRMELLRKPIEGVVVPAERTINRILTRQGLLVSRPRRRPRSSYVRWQGGAPMPLWAIDIVGGVWIVNPLTGELREAKVVTGVDDHSRFCVIAAVVERATARAVCLALAQALARLGVPEEILTDNGKQFTDRFGKRGEVLFDKICRKNGITHRLPAPASPNQNGKVERVHGTFRPEFLEAVEPFTSLAQAQAAVDAWVRHYNTDRPHQALDKQAPVTSAQRFAPVPAERREELELWLPPALDLVGSAQAPQVPEPEGLSDSTACSGGPVALLRPGHPPAAAHPAQPVVRAPGPAAARAARPAGPPPRPELEPVRIQRLADRTGVISVCGQRLGLGRGYARRTLTVAVSETTLAIELDDGDVRVVRRTTSAAVRNIKARPPRTATSIS